MKPCSSALAMARVPAKRWETREEIVRRIEAAWEAARLAPGQTNPRAMAEEACVAHHHFCRVFRSVYGVAPGAFLRNAALDQAASALTAGESPTTVAMEAGYLSASAFSHAFKQKFGVTPSVFRKNSTASQGSCPPQ